MADLTHRELQELAAKAAAIPVYEWRFNEREDSWHGARADSEEATVYWSPLTDDGDALRLAVKLGLESYHTINNDEWSCFVGYPDAGRITFVYEPYGRDPLAATRRCIVRAAAAIQLAKEGK